VVCNFNLFLGCIWERGVNHVLKNFEIVFVFLFKIIFFYIFKFFNVLMSKIIIKKKLYFNAFLNKNFLNHHRYHSFKRAHKQSRLRLGKVIYIHPFLDILAL